MSKQIPDKKFLNIIFMGNTILMFPAVIILVMILGNVSNVLNPKEGFGELSVNLLLLILFSGLFLYIYYLVAFFTERFYKTIWLYSMVYNTFLSFIFFVFSAGIFSPRNPSSILTFSIMLIPILWTSYVAYGSYFYYTQTQ